MIRQTKSGPVRFADAQWFYYFAAHGLLMAIRDGVTAVMGRRPYINPIHRNLAALHLTAPDETRTAMAKNLTNWLNGVPELLKDRPVIRNFAAYVLGMLDIKESIPDLAEAAKHDTGRHVRLYACMSLGRMEATEHADLLVECWQQTQDPSERLAIGQALCRMLGIAKYPL